jgi:hypothetical protein
MVTPALVEAGMTSMFVGKTEAMEYLVTVQSIQPLIIMNEMTEIT